MGKLLKVSRWYKVNNYKTIVGSSVINVNNIPAGFYYMKNHTKVAAEKVVVIDIRSESGETE